MEPLELFFAQGRIEGKGSDCIGPFTFIGQYTDQGQVTLVKQYLGRHAVLYRGAHDGEGTIFGQWTIEGVFTGAFAISPMTPRVASDAPIREL